MFSSIAHAMGPQAQQGGEAGVSSLMTSLMPIVMIIGVFYFLLIRPQQKRAKEQQAMVGSLKKGDKVITSGGIYGVIEEIDNEKAKVNLGETSITVLRQALSLQPSGQRSPVVAGKKGKKKGQVEPEAPASEESKENKDE